MKLSNEQKNGLKELLNSELGELLLDIVEEMRTDELDKAVLAAKSGEAEFNANIYRAAGIESVKDSLTLYRK